MKSKMLRNLGLFGLILILASTAAIIVAFVLSSVNHVSGRGALLSAFGGAFFAYIFVKIGELFTRLSNREKLNLDTLVSIEYTLNDHLNRIDLNIKKAEVLIEAVKLKSSLVNFMKINLIPVDKSRLQDLTNLDFINDMFNYYVDLEKINEGLELVFSFAVKLINDSGNMILANLPDDAVQKAYQANSEALVDMVEDSIKLLKAAENDCIELMAKSQYVYDQRNIWLSLAYSGKNGGHYDQAELKAKLPYLIEELEKRREKNTQESTKKVEKTLGKKRK